MSELLNSTKKLLQQTKKTFEAMHEALHKRKLALHPDYEEDPKLPAAPKKKNMVVDVSVGSVTKGALAIIGILALIYFLYAIQGILVLLFVSLILAAAIDPLVNAWQEKKIPRGISVMILYVIFLLIFGAVVYALIPIVVEQIVTFTKNISKIINNIFAGGAVDFPFNKELKPFYDSLMKNIDSQQVINQLKDVLSAITNQLGNIAGNSLLALGAIFNGILNALLVLVMSFFMVTNKKSINQFIRSLIPARYAPYLTHKTTQMQEKIGGWVRGQLLLCLSIGVATYIGLFILQLFGIDIQYKETLAVVAGVTEIIPYLGPVIGAIPAILIATNISGWAVLWVIILYIVLQALENNVVVPWVMNKEVGLNPIIIIFAMLVGFQFFGIIGILLCIPVATSISVFVQDYVDKEK